MATAQQIAANRHNAQHSTGPRTDASKAASSQNATRHGLTARGLIVLPGQEDNFHQLESGLRDDLRPSGPLQEVLFKRALESAWTLERCRLAEASLYVHLGKPDVDPFNSSDLEARCARIHKYAREAENSLHKAMRELGKLQSECQYRHETFPLTPAQAESDEEFERSPHAFSVLCSLAQVMKSVSTDRRNEAKTNNLNTDTELKILDNFSPSEYIRRYEANHPPEPRPAQAAAA